MLHLLIFGIVAVLLFGNRLPSVGRSIGRGLVEFKKGMDELENEFRTSVSSESDQTPLAHWEVSCLVMWFLMFLIFLVVIATRG
jgi:TatA/E family protein of Tat protein translocase